MIKLGEPFISPTMTFQHGRRYDYPLARLADFCGSEVKFNSETVEKAILLLKWKSNISYHDNFGNTLLHLLLRCEQVDQNKDWEFNKLELNHSLRTQRELLIVFITAGADVYAINHYGETPSILARTYGREKRWIKALTFCGYDYSDVISAQPDGDLHDPNRVRQTSKLSLEEYCQRRQDYRWFVEEATDDENDSSEDEESDYDGDSCDDSGDGGNVPCDHEHATENMGSSDSHLNVSCHAKRADHDISLDLSDADGSQRDGTLDNPDELEVNVGYVEENTLEGMEFSFDQPAIDPDIYEFFNFDSYLLP
jgi:hypothetical protein